MSQHATHLSLSEMTVGAADKINAFVDGLAREYFFDGPDRRSEPRFRVTVPATVQPLDERHEPLGYQVRAVTRDISTKGIGLVCQDPISTKNISIRLSDPNGDELEFVAEVLRCAPIGYYFDVGCKFLVDDAGS